MEAKKFVKDKKMKNSEISDDGMEDEERSKNKNNVITNFKPTVKESRVTKNK